MITFNFLKQNSDIVSVEYELLNFEHSTLWFNCVKDFVESNEPLLDNNRIYNFGDPAQELINEINKCNSTINELNLKYNFGIRNINHDSFQDDVNFIHTYFVDNDRIHKSDDVLWDDLNSQLHGVEIIMRRPDLEPMGQVFIRFENQLRYKLPDSAYEHFTIQKKHGYLYASYPHVGRHIFEMYLADDDHAEDEHILPMYEIAADSYLWFGTDMGDDHADEMKADLKNFFYNKKLDELLGKEFDDPRCAIGWLPVAKVCQTPDLKNLLGIEKILSVEISKET